MNSADAYRSALEKRKELQKAARSIGIDEAFISNLVDRFYDRVRADAQLGPVFDGVIGDRWSAHLQKMKLFWASVALRTGAYQGKPMEAHSAIKTARPHHFDIWLRLFEETLVELAPNRQVVDHFMRHARSISERLQEVMFS